MWNWIHLLLEFHSLWFISNIQIQNWLQWNKYLPATVIQMYLTRLYNLDMILGQNIIQIQKNSAITSNRLLTRNPNEQYIIRWQPWLLNPYGADGNYSDFA